MCIGGDLVCFNLLCPLISCFIIAPLLQMAVAAVKVRPHGLGGASIRT